MMFRCQLVSTGNDAIARCRRPESITKHWQIPTSQKGSHWQCQHASRQMFVSLSLSLALSGLAPCRLTETPSGCVFKSFYQHPLQICAAILRAAIMAGSSGFFVVLFWSCPQLLTLQCPIEKLDLISESWWSWFSGFGIHHYWIYIHYQFNRLDFHRLMTCLQMVKMTGWALPNSPWSSPWRWESWHWLVHSTLSTTSTLINGKAKRGDIWMYRKWCWFWYDFKVTSDESDWHRARNQN